MTSSCVLQPQLTACVRICWFAYFGCGNTCGEIMIHPKIRSTYSCAPRAPCTRMVTVDSTCMYASFKFGRLDYRFICTWSRELGVLIGGIDHLFFIAFRAIF